jgi:hypothetical protein
VGDGTFTLEFDTYHHGSRAGYSNFAIGLQNDVPVSWDPGRGSAGGFSGLDRFFVYRQNRYRTGIFGLYHNIDRGGRDLRWENSFALGEWYHVRLRVCGSSGFSIQVARRSDGSVVFSQSDSNIDMRIPGDIRSLHVQIMGDGEGKAIDNLRVTRGCGGAP